MATWYYRGMTPTPVDTIDRGSVVITSRSTFQATASQVAHLVRAGLVVRVKDAPAPVPAGESPAPPISVVSVEVDRGSLPSEAEASVEDAFEPTPGIPSDPDVVEESAATSVAEAVEEEAVPADGESPSPVEEKKQSGSTRKSRRHVR